VIEMLSQSIAAVQRGLTNGIKRQHIEYLLPTYERKSFFMATEPVAKTMDTTILEEFNLCVTLVIQLVHGLKGSSDEIQMMRVNNGDNNGEPCAVIYPKNKSLVAVVFPISENLKMIKKIVEFDSERPLLIVNPQWILNGQVVSDFGIGPWLGFVNKFLSSFEPIFIVSELRIGNTANRLFFSTDSKIINGGVVRLVRSYPDSWVVYALTTEGSFAYVGSSNKKPTYNEISQALKQVRKRSETMPFFRRSEDFKKESKRNGLFTQNEPNNSTCLRTRLPMKELGTIEANFLSK
jgi:hypothetical protein